MSWTEFGIVYRCWPKIGIVYRFRVEIGPILDAFSTLCETSSRLGSRKTRSQARTCSRVLRTPFRTYTQSRFLSTTYTQSRFLTSEGEGTDENRHQIATSEAAGRGLSGGPPGEGYRAKPPGEGYRAGRRAKAAKRRPSDENRHLQAAGRRLSTSVAE